MRSTLAACLLPVLLPGLHGCATAAGAGHAPGRADGPPALSTLPGLPRADERSDARTRQGLLVMREAFAAPLPGTPLDHSHASLQRWVDEDVVAWLDARREKLEQARFEFGVGREPSPVERIVAAAAAGLLQEDTARQLATIPAPAELDSEPEVKQMYREVVHAQTRPFLSSALVAYRECADLAHDGPEAMQHWAIYCDGRFQRLKVEVDADQRRIAGLPPVDASDGAQPAQGKTTTTVVVVEGE